MSDGLTRSQQAMGRAQRLLASALKDAKVLRRNVSARIAAGDTEAGLVRDMSSLLSAINRSVDQHHKIARAYAQLEKLNMDHGRVLAYLRGIPAEDREELLREAGLNDGRELLG